MARVSNALLRAEIEELRSALGKLHTELGHMQSRLKAVEGRLSRSTEQGQAAASTREPGKRLH
jgi:hypothetical protein